MRAKAYELKNKAKEKYKNNMMEGFLGRNLSIDFWKLIFLLIEISLIIKWECIWKIQVYNKCIG